MIKIENECVNCALPCIFSACPYYKVVRFYCDKCHDEADLYWFDDEQLCLDCIEKRLEKVEYNG